jgi:hypothetical protein
MRALYLKMAALPLLCWALVAPAAAKDVPQERKIAEKFGICAVALDAQAARTVVLDDLTGRDIFARHKKLVSPECLPNTAGRGMQMRFDDMTMKASLAEALVRRELAASAIADFSAIAPLAHRQPFPVETIDKKTGKPLSAKSIEAQTAAVARKTLDYQLSRMGECVVRRDAAGAKAALMTPIGDVAEMAALKTLTPIIASCIRKGEEVRFDRMALRNTLAINYYRLASAALASGGR